MRTKNIVTTYLVRLDGYYRGGAVTTRTADVMEALIDRAVVYYVGHDMLIITAANNVINATEIANTIARQFGEHYSIENIGEVSC